MVSKKTNYSNTLALFQTFIDFLIEEWNDKNYPLKEFPFNFLDCPDQFSFFSKYSKTLVPVLLNQTNSSIELLSSKIGKSVEELLEESWPKIVTTTLFERTNMVQFNFYELFRNMVEKSKMLELLTEKIDEIIVEIISYVTDVDDFKKQFEMDYFIPPFKKKILYVQDFFRVINILEVRFFLVIYKLRSKLT